MRTLAELTTQLDALEAQLPAMLEANPDPADFWPEFAGAADVIEDHAGDHCTFVHERINAMLATHGLYMAVVDGGC